MGGARSAAVMAPGAGAGAVTGASAEEEARGVGCHRKRAHERVDAQHAGPE